MWPATQGVTLFTAFANSQTRKVNKLSVMALLFSIVNHMDKV